MARSLAVAYLIVQGVAVYLWWAVLLLFPAAREPFKAPGAPDATLLAFIGADLLLYGGGSLFAAYGLARRLSWGWMMLCIDVGASVYAALYALALPLLSGGGWLGALMMVPALVVSPLLVWAFRPANL